MLKALKRRWQEFKRFSPGQRFQRLYERRQRTRRSPWKRLLYLGTALVLVIAGMVMLPAPGPGTVVVALGAAMLAQESSLVARALDWCEARIRQLVAWAKPAAGGSAER